MSYRDDDRAELDEIRRAAADLSSLELLVALGVDVKGAQRQAGGGVLVPCFAPAHADRTPSCSVRPTRDGDHAMRCFGCAASAGDVFAIAALALGLGARVDFPELKRQVADRLGVYLPERGKGEWPRPAARRPPPPPRAPEPPRFDLEPMASVLAFQGRLDGSNEVAVDVERYLAARGLLEQARAAGCFALPPWSVVAPVLADVFGLDALTGSGMLAEGANGWRRPAHRMCIPWRDQAGRVATIQRRLVQAHRPKYPGEEPPPKYVTPARLGPTAPFGAELVAVAGPGAGIVIVEGALDALALRRLDPRTDRIVLGLQGVEGWRDEWANIVRARDVWIAFDADQAGDDAAPVLRDRLLEGGARAVRRMRPVGAKDWAELLERRLAPAPERVA